MSLILEALKKLDREKKAPDRGFLVVGAVPWPAPRPRPWLPALLMVAAGVAVGSALWFAWRARTHEETPKRSAPSSSIAVAAPGAAATPAAAVVAAPPTTLRPGAARIERLGVPATPVPAAASEPGAGLVLQAISERDGKPIAVLNSRLVHEGDRFDGVTVIRIGADEVEIEVQGRRRTLRF